MGLRDAWAIPNAAGLGLGKTEVQEANTFIHQCCLSLAEERGGEGGQAIALNSESFSSAGSPLTISAHTLQKIEEKVQGPS